MNKNMTLFCIKRRRNEVDFGMDVVANWGGVVLEIKSASGLNTHFGLLLPMRGVFTSPSNNAFHFPSPKHSTPNHQLKKKTERTSINPHGIPPQKMNPRHVVIDVPNPGTRRQAPPR